MENQDKIFEQFKDIATEAESKPFPAMDKVWSRVEDKLDYKAAKKSAGIWKITAIAASLLLLTAVGYQLLDTAKMPSGTVEKKDVTAPAIQDQDNQLTTADPVIASKPQPVKTNRGNIFVQPSAVAEKIVALNAPAVVSEGNFVVTSESATVAEPVAESTFQPLKLQTISGLVSDNSGTLPGANVVVMGTTRTTHTDIDGKYSIEAKEGDKLVFSFVGMKDMVATVGDQKEINAKLPDGGVALESVIVDGFASNDKSAAKTDHSGYFATKKAKARVFKAPAYKETDKADQSEPENTISANVEFVSNAPTLYIIDGKPATEEQFKQLKTDEIATMKLLSQSEATSLYGNKAINGALIVSKKAAKTSNMTPWIDEGSTENTFESPEAAPLSTFKLAVENSSYTDIRNCINRGKKVPKEIVRIEEMINYFEYRYPQPEGAHPVGIFTEYSSCPWNRKHKLLKVGIQGKNTATVIAHDAKIQIEFNPTIVKGYRLIGYEKRKLRPEDFKAVGETSGMVGGHTVTALYEIIPSGVDSQYFEQRDDVTYTKINTGTTFRGELANIKFRYEKPEGGKSAEVVKLVANQSELLQNSSSDFRFCAAVAWFGLKLRQSELIGNRSYTELLKLAKGSVSADSEGSRGEFVRLVEAVK
jgi:Ca-activated chloride channel homolog